MEAHCAFRDEKGFVVHFEPVRGGGGGGPGVLGGIMISTAEMQLSMRRLARISGREKYKVRNEKTDESEGKWHVHNITHLVAYLYTFTSEIAKLRSILHIVEQITPEDLRNASYASKAFL